MFLLQPVLDFMHLLESTIYYILTTSYFVGRNIFLIFVRLFGVLRDFCAALVIIGEELYYFIGQLNASIGEVAHYAHSTTNSGVNCLLEALSLFFRKMTSFFTSTRVRSRVLANQAGSYSVDVLVIFKRALLLIADCLWWLLTILPRTIMTILITAGDYLVFGISAMRTGIVHLFNVVLEDVFRLTIGALVLFLLWRHRRRVSRFFVYCLFTAKALFCLLVIELRLGWQSLQTRFRVRNRNATTPLPALRRTPLPRGSRSPSAASDNKLTEAQRCVVCRDRPKCVLLLPCKHLCLCEECADYMVSAERIHDCPLCRSRVQHSMSVYI